MKRIFAAVVSVIMTAVCLFGLAGCGGDEANITIKFWNPITGPDSVYMQDLVDQFNKDNRGEIKVDADPLAEAAHYTRITTSFQDNSSADIALVHQSRLASLDDAGKLRDMTDFLASIGVKSDDYVGDVWTNCSFDGKMKAAPYDVLPIILYYNRDLIPDGYTEEQILADDFSIELMREMMAAAYVHSGRPTNITYGMAFNYSFTDSMFMSFYAQLDGDIVSADDPTEPLYSNASGYAAAEAVKSIALVTDSEGRKVCSASGSDHLNIFGQGRALFTIDGIWSAPDAVDSVNCGTVMLPKIQDADARKCSADGHSFVMFENSNTSDERDAAIVKFMKYLIDNSGRWCEGGKIAARKDIASDTEYQKLEWAHMSNRLDNIKLPVIVYTFDEITKPIGRELSKVCEDKAGAPTAMKAIQDAADAGRQAAKAIRGE